MGKIEILKTGTSFLWKTPPAKLKPESIRYIPESVEKAFENTDKFIHSSGVTETIADKTSKAAENVKKVTKREQELFRAYMKAKEFEFPLTKQEIEELMKYEGEEFLVRSIDFVENKFKIPQGLRVNITPYPQHKEIGMSYDYLKHLLYTNPNYKMETKAELFGYIVHELRHAMQNFTILRTEGIGEKAVVAYAKKMAKLQLEFAKQMIKRYSVEDYKKIAPSKEAISDFEKLKQLSKDPVAYEKNNVLLLKELENNYMYQLDAFRQKVISEMGELKADSKEGKRAKKYLKSILTNYMKKDGTMHAGKYNLAVTEREALDLGFMYEEKFKMKDEEGFCFLRFAKNYKTQKSDSAARNKEIVEERRLIDDEIKRTGWKKYLSYIYD